MKITAIVFLIFLCGRDISSKYLTGPGALSDCLIDKSTVENVNRVFVYRDERGAFQLLRTERVACGTTLLMFCTEKDVVETQCQRNGQFSINLRSEAMYCEASMQPSVMSGRDGGCPHTLYIVGYLINGQKLELFRSCYDSTGGRVVFSQSVVYYKSFFAKRPWVEFSTDGIVSQAEATSYIKSKTFDAFRCIFGDHQHYLVGPHELVINRGHLVASADFLFVDQMASTFRYINVVPQFKSINDGNWEKIERWLREQVTDQMPFQIRTGAFGVLSLPHPKGNECGVYLAGAKLPVPLWIYKLVRNADGQLVYVFLSYNNTFSRSPPDPPSNCQPIDCPLSLRNDSKNGFIFCCNPNEFKI